MKFTGKDDVDNNANTLNLLQGEIILQPYNSPLRHSSRKHADEIGEDNWTYSNHRDSSRLKNEEPDSKPEVTLETSQKEPTVELRRASSKRVEPRFADPRHHDVATVEAEIIISPSKSENKVATDTTKSKNERDSANITSDMDRDISWYLKKDVEIIEKHPSNSDNFTPKVSEIQTVDISNIHERYVELKEEPKVDYNISLESQDLRRILQRRPSSDMHMHPSTSNTVEPDSPTPLSRSSPKELLRYGFSYTSREDVFINRQRPEKDGITVLPSAEDAHIGSMDTSQIIVEDNNQNEAASFQSVLSELKRKRTTIDGDDVDGDDAQRNGKSVQFSEKPPVVIPVKERTSAPQLPPIHTKARVAKPLEFDDGHPAEEYLQVSPPPYSLDNIPVPPPLPPPGRLKKL